jgi:hypothetical protein
MKKNQYYDMQQTNNRLGMLLGSNFFYRSGWKGKTKDFICLSNFILINYSVWHENSEITSEKDDF